MKDLPLIAFSFRPTGFSRRAASGPALVWPSGRPDSVSARKYMLISELNVLPTDTPLQRFKCGLTTALAWLGAGVARYSFSVRLFHSWLHAGLSRRYPRLALQPADPNGGRLFHHVLVLAARPMRIRII